MALLQSVLAALSLDLKALSSSQAAQPAVTSVLGDLKASMGTRTHVYARRDTQIKMSPL